ncbi:30S ribosomal protein S6 [Candidatus Sumerlaeota bacterium]|nr:30S ribosomal protein S6 [Candidatus Sumerlaeota bacterium]
MATRKYELMLILDPVRTDEQQEETLLKIEEVVTKYGGTTDRHEAWGKRRLAYPIGKRRDGFYALVYFDTDSTTEVLHEVERYCRYNEDIVRFIVTLAIVGKSTGDPSRALQEDRYQRPSGPPRGRRRDDYVQQQAAAPVEQAEATPAAPAE